MSDAFKTKATEAGGFQRVKSRIYRSEVALLKAKFERLAPALDERMRRWWAGSEALSYGRGGVNRVSAATGMNRNTVAVGLREIQQRGKAPAENRPQGRRIRRSGGGRKPLTDHDPQLRSDLETLVDPATRGDPMSPLRWTCKSVRRLAKELRSRGRRVSPRTVADLLHQMGYSLQANRKTRAGASHPDRNAQFEYVAARTQQYLERGQPVISIDTKKKEQVGDFKNGGQEWQPKKSPELVRTHDFLDPRLGKGIPRGVYDVGHNAGWVSVGIDHDTAAFAIESVRRWWKQMGSKVYPHATQLLITADAGGGNGYRTRWWKVQLQHLARELGFPIAVCHFPPGTSKWNKIEHRMFCHITANWRGRPLVSHEVMVNLIANTSTEKGLTIQAELDTNTYPTGIKVTDQEMAQLKIQPADFHGEWNYTISP